MASFILITIMYIFRIIVLEQSLSINWPFRKKVYSSLVNKIAILYYCIETAKKMVLKQRKIRKIYRLKKLANQYFFIISINSWQTDSKTVYSTVEIFMHLINIANGSK